MSVLHSQTTTDVTFLPPCSMQTAAPFFLLPVQKDSASLDLGLSLGASSQYVNAACGSSTTMGFQKHHGPWKAMSLPGPAQPHKTILLLSPL